MFVSVDKDKNGFYVSVFDKTNEREISLCESKDFNKILDYLRNFKDGVVIKRLDIRKFIERGGL